MRLPDPDRDLVLDVQKADREGRENLFRTLYDRHKDRVYTLCSRITGNGTDALDAAQATFCVVFRTIDGFRFQSRFSSWLHRIAVNCSYDVLRARARGKVEQTPPLFSGGGLDSAADPGAVTPDAALAKEDLERIVHQAVARLTPRLRAVVALRYFEEHSYEEIAEILGTSMGTVKSRLFRAHEALSRRLGPTCGAGGLR